jgi:hypothetical protein
VRAARILSPRWLFTVVLGCLEIGLLKQNLPN